MTGLSCLRSLFIVQATSLVLFRPASSPSMSEDLSCPSTPVACAAVPDGDAASPAVSKSRGRPRGRPSARPKIDIDDEIEEANRLADLFKRMKHASQVAARNASRSKQRLMKKASKLSQLDLMRLATLKRCGLVEINDDVEDKGAGSSPTVGAPIQLKKTSSAASVKVKGVVEMIPGASELLKSLESGFSSSAPGASASSSCAAAAVPLSRHSLTFARGIKRLPSAPAVDLVAKKQKGSFVNDPDIEQCSHAHSADPKKNPDEHEESHAEEEVDNDVEE